MQYREFGNTGVKISVLGFGAMRLPEVEKDGKRFVDEDKAIEVIHRAFDLGVNYIDTAYNYLREQGEYVVGKALKGYEDKVYVATKLPTWMVEKTEDYRRLLEEQLKKLDRDYIDFYHFHFLNDDRYNNKVLRYNLPEEAAKAKAEGLIRHISFSFHDKPEVMIKIIDSGVFETVLCQYNLLNRSNEEAIAYAISKGLGTAVMGPVGGGRLAFPSELFRKKLGEKAKSTPELALRFVTANRNVCCALSGMNTVEMVEQNARVASLEEPLSTEELKKVDDMLQETKELEKLYCTGCGYCTPCPKGIKIPQVFQALIYHRVYGLTDYAKQVFSKFGSENNGAHPADCIKCGKCAKKCPQNINIPERLKEAVKELS